MLPGSTMSFRHLPNTLILRPNALQLHPPAGSLVLGQNQECYGGCFSPQYQLHGDMAVLRVWDRALRQVRPYALCPIAIYPTLYRNPGS